MTSYRDRRSDDKEDPLSGISWARVLDHEKPGAEVCAISEQGMMVLRVAVSPDAGRMDPGSRIYIGEDISKRDTFIEILGFSRIRTLSNAAKAEMMNVIENIIKDDGDGYISRFFNRAGNLSLKMHAFELLHGVGNRKAMEMVKARGREGFSGLEDLDNRCSIDSANLLAQRFIEEIEDKKIQPRLCELISRRE